MLTFRLAPDASLSVLCPPPSDPMKAILCTHFGGPDELELADIPAPAAGRGEVVVAVKAAALNFFDTLIIAGKYQHKPPWLHNEQRAAERALVARLGGRAGARCWRPWEASEK